MLIIGERINSSRKSIKQAIVEKNSKFLIEQARMQLESGSNFIDVTCALSLENEKEDLAWLIKTLQNELNTAISIDSPDPEAIDIALKIHKGKPFVNSVTAEKDKLYKIVEIIKNKDLNIIALTMDDGGVPSTSEHRIELARELFES